jgi:carboxyl-terminal processing protease
VIYYIQQEYVDTVRQKFLVDIGIEEILKHLDPHSAYIPAEELQATNEPLEGNSMVSAWNFIYNKTPLWW